MGMKILFINFTQLSVHCFLFIAKLADIHWQDLRFSSLAITTEPSDRPDASLLNREFIYNEIGPSVKCIRQAVGSSPKLSDADRLAWATLSRTIPRRVNRTFEPIQRH